MYSMIARSVSDFNVRAVRQLNMESEESGFINPELLQLNIAAT